MEALRVAFLRRLMRETDAFILRGGMRIRQLIGTREVSDVDLVGSNANETHHVLGAVLRANSNDGVQFHRSRIDSFEGTDGLRALVQGSVGGKHTELIVDVVHGVDLWPEPQWVHVHGVRIRAAHPASIIATKLRLLVVTGGPRIVTTYWRCCAASLRTCMSLPKRWPSSRSSD